MKLEKNMTNMFKKTIIASALFAAASATHAATVAITGVNVSQEGSAGALSIAVPNVVVTLGAEYTVNDIVTFTLSGAEFDIALSAPAIAYADASGGDFTGTMTLGLLNNTATTATFRITDLVPVTGDAITTGDTLTLSGLVMTTATVLDETGDISVAYSAETNTAQVLDGTGTLTDVAATVVAQLSSSVTKPLNGIIDVENGRQQFTAGNDTITTDVLVVTLTEAVAAVNDAVYDGAVHVIEGDFSWMDTDGTPGVDAGELAAAFGVTGNGDDTFVSVINAAMNAITITATDLAADAVEAHTMTFTVAGVGVGNAILSAQDFDVSTTINYTTAAAAAATKATAVEASAGSWTLNGSAVNIPYMPYGSGISQIINLNNAGTQSGDVSVEGFDRAGNFYGPVVVGTAAPGAQTALAGAIKAALVAEGLPASERVSLTVVSNVPADDVTVYSAYNPGTGTVMIVNDSNGK